MAGYRADMTFSMKILAKPRQMEMIEEQLKMLSAKAESVSNDFSRIKELVRLIVDPRHIEGLEGAKS
jgi:archaellum component FlaC